MTSFLGTAKMLSELKNQWHGTLVVVAQPAEEIGRGADAMLRDGLYEKVGRPDYALALHDSATLPAGQIGYCPGYALANIDAVDITIRGVGGHGAVPQATKDPIVIASQVILALQTIVSRENSPLDPAVVTVGSIHGGAKRNVIPDEVKLQLTVRSYKDDVRQNLLASIERIAKGIAEAAGVPADRAPVVQVLRGEAGNATYNDPQLVERLVPAWQKALGASNVVKVDPVMVSEDFGSFGLAGRPIPIALFWLGAVDPANVEAARAKRAVLPPLHSSQFAPLPEPAIRTGIRAMTTAVMELMK
jgi:hippurate hydrolase